MTTTEPSRVETIVAEQLMLGGRVQGVGLRPAIVRLAGRVGVFGYVVNKRCGVRIHVEGAAERVGDFLRSLDEALPSGAKVDRSERCSTTPTGATEFAIRVSTETEDASCLSPDGAPASVALEIPLDTVPCVCCRADVTAGERRTGYPLTTCSECGPRYTILRALPFERASTTMDAFPLCGACLREFLDPANRRFHAQTTSCARCGPEIWLRQADRVERGSLRALQSAVGILQQGGILAIRGVGGYQLLTDATSEAAVTKLRRRKGRLAKPLAVITPDLESASAIAEINPLERAELLSSAGPIVILRRKQKSGLAESVSLDLDSVGVMLPSSPLHALLTQRMGRALVCTSGNLEGEPLQYRVAEADQKLGSLADGLLHHRREIERPIDDSVIRVIGTRSTTVRLARGLAPLTLPLLATKNQQAWIALGGHQKQAVAVAHGTAMILGPHTGDLETEATRQRMVQQLDGLRQLFGGLAEARITCDRHPDYFSTQLANSLSLKPTQVQHHHAHIAATAFEHGLGDRDVLGVAFDGTGYGDDGTIWGGEVLVVGPGGYRRVGHLRTFPLFGGEQAIREPWRVALALVADALGPDCVTSLPFPDSAQQLVRLLDRPQIAKTTSSMGRLFDGVASLILGLQQSRFEGQPAMMLESICDRDDSHAYPLPVHGDPRLQLDWRPLLRELVADLIAGEEAGRMAMRFHRSVAAAVIELAKRFPALPLVVSGGVFQNRMLGELILEACDGNCIDVALGGRIPMNDGGLAAGQLCVALQSKV